MTCSPRKLTQFQKKSNNFSIPRGKLATRGLFEDKIKFEQWHIFRELKKYTENVNVINLASLLAVLPRMGIYAYEITQAELAEKMADMFEMPRVPARRTISSWENKLSDLGYIEIPKHVDWRNSKTKIRVLTEKFWQLSRAGLPELSYTCPHGTYCTGKVERVEHYTPEEPTDQFIQTKIRGRARELTVKSEVGSGRACAVHENKNLRRPETQPKMRPPKRERGIGKKLSKFQNSVLWWLFQNHNLTNYREGVILSARFLECGADDDFCSQLQNNWRDCGDASRPGLVSGLIKYLRTLDPGTGPDAECKPPLQIVQAPPPDVNPDPIGEIIRIKTDMDSRILNPRPDKNCPPENTGIIEEKSTDSKSVIESMVQGKVKCDTKFMPLISWYRSANQKERRFIISHMDSLILIGVSEAVQLLNNYREVGAF